MLIGSAGKELATDFSAQSRDLLIEHGSAFGVSVRDDKRGAGAWELDQGGKYRAVSVGAAVFGYGAHIAVIDDYCGSIADALSQAERDATHRWYHGTIRNRLESEESAIVIVATRYHKNDLVGRLLKEQAEGGDQWRVLSLPALCVNAGDAMGRKPGEALWPERWSTQHLENERKALGISGYPWMFEALYQGTPLDVIDSEWPAEYFGDHIWFGGDELDEHGNRRFKDWPHPSEIVNKVMYVDPSLGKTSKSDYSAIVMLAKDIHGDYYIDADLGRRPSVQIAYDAIQHHKEFRPLALGWEVQDADLLKAEVLRQAQQEGEDVWFLAITNRINKLVRIRSLSPLLDARRLKFRRNSPGVNLLLEQMRAFPAHKHDDGPDALEGAVRLERQIGSGEIIEDHEEQEYLEP